MNDNPRDSDVMVLVVGADPEVTGAIASIIRGKMNSECLETVAMSGYRNSPSYHVWNKYSHLSEYDLMDVVDSECSDMLEAVYKTRPHMFRAFTVAIDCVEGGVTIDQQSVERVETCFQGLKITSEVIQ